MKSLDVTQKSVKKLPYIALMSCLCVHVLCVDVLEFLLSIVCFLVSFLSDYVVHSSNTINSFIVNHKGLTSLAELV